jgi:hypothetical protein
VANILVLAFVLNYKDTTSKMAVYILCYIYTLLGIYPSLFFDLLYIAISELSFIYFLPNALNMRFHFILFLVLTFIELCLLPHTHCRKKCYTPTART